MREERPKWALMLDEFLAMVGEDRTVDSKDEGEDD